MNRYQITAMTVSAATLVGIAGYEGYSSTAYVPVKGDVPTIGWGTTAGVKKGETLLSRRRRSRDCTGIPRWRRQGSAAVSKCRSRKGSSTLISV